MSGGREEGAETARRQAAVEKGWQLAAMAL